jgi:hypothetical protein
LQSVATAFIESYMSRGDPLPTEVETAASETTEPQLFGEVSVAI